MKIKRKNLWDGACHFCSREKLNGDQKGFIYPYETVVEFTRAGSNGLLARICDECLSELIEFKEEKNAQE